MARSIPVWTSIKHGPVYLRGWAGFQVMPTCGICLQEARWWPAVIDLGVLIAFRDLAKQVGLTAHRAWLATAFFCAGSVFQEAYFCPQNIAYLLTIIVYARVFGNRRAGGVASKSDWLVVVPCLFAISITHQITPYMLTVALIALALFGYLKSNWFIAAAIVPHAHLGFFESWVGQAQ